MALTNLNSDIIVSEVKSTMYNVCKVGDIASLSCELCNRGNGWIMNSREMSLNKIIKCDGRECPEV